MQTERILIVGNNFDTLEILADALREYRLSFAGHGKTAVARAKSERPDLVVLGVAMPGKSGPDISGYGFLRAVNEDPVLRFLKVIVVSADPAPGDQLIALELGAIDYLTEPLDKRVLGRKVARLIGMRSQEEVQRDQRMMMRYLQHHTRTGLNMISCATEMLVMSDPSMTADGLASVAIVREGTERLLQLIRHTELLAGIAERKYEAEETCLHRLLAENTALFEGAARNRVLSLPLPRDDGAFAVMGDEWMLVRSIAAMVNHVAERSTIGAPVSVRLEKIGTSSAIIVTGTGNGFADDVLPHLFTPFFMDEQWSYVEFDGIDLQLPAVSMVARLHGGTMTVRNLPGGDAEIAMTIPLMETPPLRNDPDVEDDFPVSASRPKRRSIGTATARP